MNHCELFSTTCCASLCVKVYEARDAAMSTGMADGMEMRGKWQTFAVTEY